jgi:hypothetical protein
MGDTLSKDILGQIPNWSDKGIKYGMGKGPLGENGLPTSIDCSNLVREIVKAAGFEAPSISANNYLNSPFYERIDPKDVRPGDIAVWSKQPNGHVGFVMEFDYSEKRGKFFGSQSKTGPDDTIFNEKKVKGF